MHKPVEERDIDMNKLASLSIVTVLALILSACNIGGGTPNTNAVDPALLNVSTLGLGIQALNGNEPFNKVGQTINVGYVVTNLGGTALAGPVAILDTLGTVTCPEVNTVGNANGSLDPTESITCTSIHVISQADINNGSITRTATASAVGVSSQQVTVAISIVQNRSLSLTVTVAPTNYNQLGQTITYTYVAANNGNVTLGPGQFTVADDRLGGQINCGANTTVLAPGETVTCGATYIVAQTDLSANTITNKATASGGGAGPSQIASATVNNTNVVNNPSSSNLTPGATIQYTVVAGEWLIQIARCYGADYKEVRNANLQIANPNAISPGMVVTVPRIGSAGKIYGAPCVGTHTVQSGETWESIAQKYNADVLVLQTVNSGGLSVGRVLKVPLNSAGVANPTSGVAEPIRITIPAQSGATTLTGIVSPQGIVRYIVKVNQNEILDIKVTAPAGEVALRVYQQGGGDLKPKDTTLTWAGTITNTGDYVIELTGVAGTANKNFTLVVSIVPITS